MLVQVLSHEENWRPDPMPGSLDAVVMGCSCPYEQPQPPRYVFETDCKVHELELKKPD